MLTIVVLAATVALPALAAEINDPMRPPPFALQKFRLEKLKNNPPVDKQETSARQTTTWELNSILYSQQRQHAIINNQLVKKGAMVDGAKLVTIKRDGVRLIARGKVINLTLPGKQAIIKKSLDENKL